MTTVLRRHFLTFGGASFALACVGARQEPNRIPELGELAALEMRVGGRLGVFALDTESGRSFGRRADERFAMCSTFKWLLGAVVFRSVDRGDLSLDEEISFGESDLLDHAPVTRRRAREGKLSIIELVEATIRTSDNTAANLLLRKVGGPAVVTAFARSLGDEVTRLDRDEPSLNENASDDPRDTTSPRAMVELLRRCLWDESALSNASRGALADILRTTETGKRRLRAGFPAKWDSGDKTGTGDNGAVNDVAFTIPGGRAPILVAVYMSHSTLGREKLEEVHAEVGRLVAREFAARH